MSIGSKVAVGASWSFGARAISQVVQFATSILLARLIEPELFGLVTMVTAFTSFASLFAELGIGSAIVQRRELNQGEIDAAFCLTVTAGAGLAATTWIAAPVLAEVYHRQSIVVLTRWIGFGFLLTGIGVVPRALLVRRLALRHTAVIEVVGVAATAGAGCVLAWAGLGVWALVAPGLLGAAVSSALYLVKGGWPSRFPAAVSAAVPLLRVSGFLLGFTIVNYWARTLDNLLIGMWLGERELGLYSRAYSLMLLPITQLTVVLGNAMLPGLSRLQDDAAQAKRLFMRVLGLVGYVAFPLMLGLAAVAEPFVALVYGARWSDMTPILRILAPVGALQAVLNPTGWLFISSGRTRLMLGWGLVSSTLLMTGIVLGVRAGSGLTVATGYFCANVVLFLPGVLIAGQSFGIGYRDLHRALSTTAAAATAMAIFVLGIQLAAPGLASPLGMMTLLIPGGAVVYVAVCRWARCPAALEAAALVEVALARVSPRLVPLARVLAAEPRDRRNPADLH